MIFHDVHRGLGPQPVLWPGHWLRHCGGWPRCGRRVRCRTEPGTGVESGEYQWQGERGVEVLGDIIIIMYIYIFVIYILSLFFGYMIYQILSYYRIYSLLPYITMMIINIYIYIYYIIRDIIIYCHILPLDN